MIRSRYSWTGMMVVSLAASFLLAPPAEAAKPTVIRDTLNGLDFRYIVALDQAKFACSKQQIGDVRQKVKAFARAELGPQTRNQIQPLQEVRGGSDYPFRPRNIRMRKLRLCVNHFFCASLRWQSRVSPGLRVKT